MTHIFNFTDCEVSSDEPCTLQLYSQTSAGPFVKDQSLFILLPASLVRCVCVSSHIFGCFASYGFIAHGGHRATEPVQIPRLRVVRAALQQLSSLPEAAPLLKEGGLQAQMAIFLAEVLVDFFQAAMLTRSEVTPPLHEDRP